LGQIVLAWALLGLAELACGGYRRGWLSWDWQFRSRRLPDAENARAPNQRTTPLMEKDVGAWANPHARTVSGHTATHFIAPSHVAVSAGSLQYHVVLVASVFLLLMVAVRWLHFYFTGGGGGLPSVLRDLGRICRSQDPSSGPGLLIATLSQPGRPDALFGSLCLFSNVFFAALATFFWRHRKTLEVVWMALVTLASTIYHYYQIHPHCGPLDHLTSGACMVDVTLSVSFGLYVASRYPGRRKALTVALAALLCFVVPSLLPAGRIAEVAYSLLHSAWHGLAAAAAYICVRPSLASRGGGVSREFAKVGAFLMKQSAGRKVFMPP